MARDPTTIGRVRHVLGSTVTVELDADLAGVAPIYRGRLQPVGQIGALVRMPQGLVDLIGAVRLVGIAELTPALAPGALPTNGERWLQVDLIGELDALGRFQRGIGTYPGLDDPVNFATPETLAAVFPAPGERRLRLGRLSAAPEVPVCVDADLLVLRHAAVVGSTGAGKTSAVASLLQQFMASGYPSANIVVIDPHGEYAGAMGDDAVYSVLPATGAPTLEVPYWALGAEDILRALTAGSYTGATVPRWRDLVTEARQEFAAQSTWLDLDPAAITADTPVPFDIRRVWWRLDYANRETRDQKNDDTSVREIAPGDPDTLKPAQFEPYQPGSAKPDQGPSYGHFGTTPERIRKGLQDPQLAFMLEPHDGLTDPLPAHAARWLGDEAPLSVLDFSGVPADVADLAIGVVVSLLFELALRSREEGIGRPRPVLLVLEEAHRYLNDEASVQTRGAVNRIAREGRKYGVGLMLVTQRPSELPDTALAQCGTLIALRLTNGSDQQKIRQALPDTVAGLAEILPSLRTGEAVVSGEAVVLPARALVDPPSPRPAADDPSLEPWRAELGAQTLDRPIASWRGLYDVADDSASEN